MKTQDLQAIKFNRMSEPERILLDSFKNLEKIVNKNGNISYQKGDKVYYHYFVDDFILYYDDKSLYLNLKKYFNTTYDLKNFLIKIIKKHLKIHVITLHVLDFTQS